LFEEMVRNERIVQSDLASPPSPDFSGVSLFLAVAKAGGFRAAAGRLGVTASAVSQGIRSLEQRLGVPLFARSTRSVSLTEAGRRLLEHATPAAELLGAGLLAATELGGVVSGSLRVTAPRIVLPLLTARVLPGLLTAHPRLSLQLVGEDRPVDLVREGYDAGVRAGQHVEPDMVATALTPPDAYVVVGAPQLFEAHGRPKNVADLSRFPCVAFQRPGAAVERWRFRVAGRVVTHTPRPRFATNDVAALLSAVEGGVGLFQFPRALVRSALASGTLEAVLERHAIERPGLTLYYPQRSRSLPSLRAFAAWARERLTSRTAPPTPSGTPRGSSSTSR
jgi:DNA-binding transcriptional LysR family regulator